MQTLYLAWQDPEDRRWLPVGRLSFDGHIYRFVYTKGVEQSPRFVPFGARNIRVSSTGSTYGRLKLNLSSCSRGLRACGQLMP